MAFAVRVKPNRMSKADYERVMRSLQEDGHGNPEGRREHQVLGDDEVVETFEVWDTHEQFRAHNDRFVTAMQAAGVDADLVTEEAPVPEELD